MNNDKFKDRNANQHTNSRTITLKNQLLITKSPTIILVTTWLFSIQFIRLTSWVIASKNASDTTFIYLSNRGGMQIWHAQYCSPSFISFLCYDYNSNLGSLLFNLLYIYTHIFSLRDKNVQSKWGDKIGYECGERAMKLVSLCYLWIFWSKRHIFLVYTPQSYAQQNYSFIMWGVKGKINFNKWWSTIIIQPNYSKLCSVINVLSIPIHFCLVASSPLWIMLSFDSILLNN